MEHVLGNIFVRPFVLAKAGDVMKGHQHKFDHVTYIARGSVRARCWRQAVNADGTPMLNDAGDEVWVMQHERELLAGGKVLIKAEMAHEFKALEDNTEGNCIYAHRTPQGDVVQDYNGWVEAYG